MSLATITCPNCHHSDGRLWAEENGFTAQKCSACGLVYVNPRPPLDAIDKATESGQHRTEKGTVDVTFNFNPLKISRYRGILNDLYGKPQAGDAPVRWLDVGAGYGEFMRSLSGVLPAGSRIAGIEPMAPKCRWAQAQGLDIRPLTIDDVGDRYDAISLINVFSHIPDFRGFLARLKERLQPSGELLIETGNGGDLESRQDYPDTLYLPDHLVFAGEAHMRAFLTEAGFEVVSVHRYRQDTLVNFAKNVAKLMMGRAATLTVPYTSPFRTVFYRARLVS